MLKKTKQKTVKQTGCKICIHTDPQRNCRVDLTVASIITNQTYLYLPVLDKGVVLDQAIIMSQWHGINVVGLNEQHHILFRFFHLCSLTAVITC